MMPREGDLIKTQSGVVFDVKGTTHPQDKIIAFPRFIPSAQGTRKGKTHLYGKVYSLDERFNYLNQNHPDLIVFDDVFGETLCEVPLNHIIEHYQPTKKLTELRHAKNLSALEKKALNLAEELKHNANIPWSSIGISGSIMAGLTTPTSDIDPIVYGTENSHKAYLTLQQLQKTPSSGFKPYTTAELKTLYDFRSKDTHMSFNDFSVVESRKAFQGMYQGIDYFIRFIKEPNETPQQYGDIYYQNSGYSKICSTITDAQDALYTPCTYKLGNVQVLEGLPIVPLEEVVSFRGRFCMQAAIGEKIEAQGKIERVINKKSGKEHYRLILGNKPQDYMILLH
jgi:predicted nucleotidyltransferase